MGPLPRLGRDSGRLAADILTWARELYLVPGDVTYAELTLDFKLTVQRVLPAQPEHALRLVVLPLQERAAILRQAIRALQPHMLAGLILPAEESLRCRSLIPLGGRAILGVKGRPYFASRGRMAS